MKKFYNSVIAIILLLSFSLGAFADLKIRQKVSMSGQTYETTKMIKGARQRTEQKGSGAMASYMSQVATIEQCDLRRNVQLNDSKKLYFIEPFAEEAVPQKATPQTRQTNQPTKQGGTVTMTYNVTDTGERQTLFGLQARHLKVLQETESSADSCSGAHKSKMEIDGWYVDFTAEFNCPMDIPRTPGQMNKPDCRDRVIFKGNRNANPGFLLNGTMTFYDENGNVMMSQTTETLELSRSPLAAALFDIPADYKLAASQQELYAMPDVNAMIREQQRQQQNNDDENPSTPVTSGRKNVGINITLGADARVNQSEISQYLQDKLRENNLNSRLGTGGVDYVLNVDIKKAKESAASKAGGIFGKVTGIETKAGKTDVELVMTLTKSNSGTPLTQSRVARKFDGTAAEALKAAIDEALGNILGEIQN
jgi:hypothetical protein